MFRNEIAGNSVWHESWRLDVPNEWNLDEAYIQTLAGDTIIDAKMLRSSRDKLQHACEWNIFKGRVG